MHMRVAYINGKMNNTIDLYRRYTTACFVLAGNDSMLEVLVAVKIGK